MKTRFIRFTDPFFRDLEAIYDVIAPVASARIALSYIDRIEAYCNSFDLAAERGTRRDDIRAGLRVIGFEKRAVLVFEVYDDRVLFLRVFYGGQDWEAQFRDEGEA